jgi:hypothetical protein
LNLLTLRATAAKRLRTAMAQPITDCKSVTSRHPHAAASGGKALDRPLVAPEKAAAFERNGRKKSLILNILPVGVRATYKQKW